MVKKYKSAEQTFSFDRYPEGQAADLQAWDAGDELILQTMSEKHSDYDKNVLIYNDSFGFLGVMLQQYQPDLVVDSFMARKGAEGNLALNKIDQDLNFINPDEADKKYDVIIIKLPKSLELLDAQLHRISDLLTPDGTVIAGGMTRNIHTSTFKHFNKYFQEVEGSLAKKKARLIFAEKAVEKKQPLKNFDFVIGRGLQISTRPGLFGGAKMDLATAFLLENCGVPNHAQDIVDLGCGNGVIGLSLAKDYPDRTFHFVDESQAAVEVAKVNWKKNFGEAEAHFVQDHGLQSFADNSVDVIVTNPPFHQGYVNTNQLAEFFFTEAARVLKDQGQLWVVANNHLGYQVFLDNIFSRVKIARKSKKFLVYKAVKEK